MRRIMGWILLVVPVLGFAEPVQMATYFPVPYVAYSRVNSPYMTVGLSSNACQLSLGCATFPSNRSPLAPISSALNLYVEGGKLDLNGNPTNLTNSYITSKKITLGSGSGGVMASLTFKNVQIIAAQATFLTANKLYAKNLVLFGKAFPSCAAALGTSTGAMRWENLNLTASNAQTAVYLVCGPAN